MVAASSQSPTPGTGASENKRTRHHDQIRQQIRPPRHHMLLVKKQSSRPVHILFRTPEIIDRHHNPRHQRLQLPSSPVISQPPDRPQQQRRRHHMKQAEQADHQRQARIEHIFRAADNMSPRQQRPREINRVDRLKQKQSRRHPRKNQRTLQPQPNPDQHISQIAEEKKILRPVLPPVHRSPHEQPHRPRDLEPQRQPHGPLLYATGSGSSRPSMSRVYSHARIPGAPSFVATFAGICGSCASASHHRSTTQILGPRITPVTCRGLTPVPTMALVWVTKLFSSVPTKKPPAQ